MKFLKGISRLYLDLKMIWKLTFGFGLILVMLFCLVWVGRLSVYQTQGFLEQVIHGQLEPLVYLNDIRSYLSELEVGTRDALLQNDDVAFNYLKNEYLPHNVHNTVDYSFTKLISQANTKNEVAQLMQLQGYWLQYYQHYKTLFENKQLYYQADFRKETNQLRYFLIGGIDRMVEQYYRQQALLAQTRTHQSIQNLESTTGLIIIIAIVLAFGVSILTAWVIVRPLTRMASASRKIARGELQEQLPINRCDEFGEVMECFNIMSAELRFLVEQIKNAAEKVHQNSTKLMDDSVAVTTVTRELMTMMNHVSAGAEVQQQKVATIRDVIGNVAEFADAVNQVAAAVEKLSSQSVSDVVRGEAAVREALAKMNRVQLITIDSEKTMEQVISLIDEMNSMALMVENIAQQTDILARSIPAETSPIESQRHNFSTAAKSAIQLAAQTHESVSRTKQLIKKIQEMFTNLSIMIKTEKIVIGEGQKAISGLDAVFRGITDSAKEVNQQLGMVTLQTSALSREHSDVLKTVEQIAAIAGDHKNGTEKASIAAVEHFSCTQEIISCSQILVHWGEHLRKAVDRFKLTKSGSRNE